MRSSRAQERKYMIRSVRGSEVMIKEVDALASDLLNKGYELFLEDVNKLNSCGSIRSNIIDQIHLCGKSNITDLWRSYFCNIINANSIDRVLKSEIMEILENVLFTEDMPISSVEVSHLIGELKCVHNSLVGYLLK